MQAIAEALKTVMEQQLGGHPDEPPAVDVLVIVTCGRLTGDADLLFNKHNEGRKRPRIEKMVGVMLESVLLRDRSQTSGLGLFVIGTSIWPECG